MTYFDMVTSAFVSGKQVFLHITPTFKTLSTTTGKVNRINRCGICALFKRRRKKTRLNSTNEVLLNFFK